MICYYYLTFNCVCRCEYCPIWQDETLDDSVVPSLSTVERNLASLSSMGFNKIVFTGGEPFLYEDLKDVLGMSRKKKFRTVLYTNGLLSPKVLPGIAALIDELYISIDHPMEDEHNRIKGQECFSESLDALSAAKSLGIDPSISFTVTRDSIRYLPEMLELAQSKQVKMFISPVHHYHGLEGLEPISVDYITRYSKAPGVVIDDQLMSLIKHGGNDTSRTSCKVLNNSISISPDDRLFLPCFWNRQASIPIEGQLEKLLKSDIVRGYRKLQGTMAFCEGCLAKESIDRSLSGKIKSADITGNVKRSISYFLKG